MIGLLIIFIIKTARGRRPRVRPAVEDLV